MISFASQFIPSVKIEPKAVKASLFFKDKLGLELLPFDLIVDESHTLEFSASDHSLENGAIVTDHITQKLRTCQITGMFTNLHIAKKRGSKESDYNVKVENNNAIENVSQKNYMELEKIAKKREPVMLSCSLFSDSLEMIITSLSVKRSSKDGSSITFTLGLREFKVVQLKNVNVFGKYKPKDMELKDERAVCEKITNGKVSAEQQDIIVNEMKAVRGN